MREKLYRCVVALLAAVIGLGTLAVVATGLAASISSAATPIPDRDIEPVVIAGKAVTALLGYPADQLFVYVYDGSAWRQIPSQVDEVTSAGVFTSTENGILDGNDEIVFMVKDLGARAPVTAPITASMTISNAWYEIEVTDPLSPSQQGWAYVVRSAALASTVTEDYVQYVPGFHRIVGTEYALGFGTASIGADYLALGGSGMDILDRTKMRIHCAIPGVCPLTESWYPPRPDDVTNDGPVRVVARGGEVLAYGSMLQWNVPFDIPRTLSGTVRFSVDFNQQTTGSVYYNDVVTTGVTVDGITDTVPAAPYSPWWQVSTVSGTLVHVADTSAISGTQSNYYVDNAELDTADTGDQQHYGDTGVIVEDPNLSFTYSVTLYFLEGAQPNVGPRYQALATNPLTVTAHLVGTPEPDPCNWLTQSYQDFYAPPALGTLTPDRLGELLRVEHIRSYSPAEVAAAAGIVQSTYGAEAYRILYLSQTPAGVAQAVSGLLVVPTGSAPQGGFPVVAHGHGTTGLADDCAPSKYAPNAYPLLDWVARGYLVSASDYVGLGTPGLHPYAVGESEARSLLDGARAAQGFCDVAQGITSPIASSRFFLEGFSQGAQGALFAHQIWQSYAPELDLLGTVTFAPGSELRLLTQRTAQGTSKLATPAALAMYSYRDYYGAPADLSGWLKEPYASEMGQHIDQECLLSLTLWIGYDAANVFQPDLMAAAAQGRWDDLQPYTTYLDANTPGDFGSSVPVFIGQGERDSFVLPEISENLTRRLCDNGTLAQLNRYQYANHTTISSAARPDALQWMADRLAGLPAPDSCDEVKLRVYLPLVLRNKSAP